MLARLTSWRPGQQEVRQSDLTKPKLANYLVTKLHLCMKKAELVNGFKNGHAQYRAQHGGKHIILSEQMQDPSVWTTTFQKYSPRGPTLATASLHTSINTRGTGGICVIR